MSASPDQPADSSWLRPALVASWKEFVLVLVIFIGPFVWRSDWSALYGSSHGFLQRLLSDSLLLSNSAIESGLLALFLAFLHWRGWTKTDFKIKVGGSSTPQGIGLAILMGLGNALTVLGALVVLFLLQNRYAQFVPFLAANTPTVEPHSIHLSWMILLGSMILNAFFEELICIGYVFNQLAAKEGPRIALVLTVLVRMSCHSYQGFVHMLGIGAVFLITGLWYWRTRNLWPLIFAHALADSVSLALLKMKFG